MKIDFNISEFNITGEPIPEHVADNLLLYHIAPMQIVRNLLNIPIWASKKSGYRPVWYELQNDRSGNSQHTFKGMGAVDWTCNNFIANKNQFLNLIIKYTKYSRMAVYRSFIHCDYKITRSNRREVYKSNSSSKWVLTDKI